MIWSKIVRFLAKINQNPVNMNSVKFLQRVGLILITKIGHLPTIMRELTLCSDSIKFELIRERIVLISNVLAPIFDG